MIEEGNLQRLVDRFYDKVRADDLLGPIFNNTIADWPEHLEKLGAFWSSVMLTSGRYKGNPMVAHLRLASRIDPAMFDHWLKLWGETATELLDAPGAAAVTAKAERIAESLQLGMFFQLPSRGGSAA